MLRYLRRCKVNDMRENIYTLTMVVPTEEFQSDTFASSELDDLSFDAKRVQIFAKHMLQGRLFMGSFQEKRYVDSIKSYRDVVSLLKEEQKLIQDILTVKQRIESLYSSDHWIGITTPDMIGTPAAYSLWVELPENTLLGTYWFKIRRIKFNNNETCLRIKILRAVTQNTHQTPSRNKDCISEDNTLHCDFVESIKENIKEKIIYILQNVTTFSNFRESIVFLCMLLAAVIMSLFQLLKCISEFSLKFMNEFSNFMKSVAPIFQIVANLFEGLFRTLCMLIVYLFGGRSPQTTNRYSQGMCIRRDVRAFPSPYKKRDVIIEEVE